MPPEILLLLIHNYTMKQLSTKEEVLKIVSKRYKLLYWDLQESLWEDIWYFHSRTEREVNFSEPLYNLIGKLKLPNDGRILAGKGLPQTGFLMRFLHIIFIKHNSASEEDIWKILKKKQIYSSK